MVVIITGASSGFGESIRRYLAAEGHTVYGTSRNPDTDDEYMLRLDVTDVRMAADVVAHVVRRCVERRWPRGYGWPAWNLSRHALCSLWCW